MLQQEEMSDLCTVAVYPTHVEAESAIGELRKAGFDLTKMSIIAQDYHTDEHVVGYYNIGQRVSAWGRQGAFWGGVFGLFSGTGLFFVPGLGPVLVAGPAVAWIVAGLEGAVVADGLSVVGAALYSIGIPRDSVLEYESDIRAGKFVLVVHGSNEEAIRANDLLATDAQQYEFKNLMSATMPPAPTPLVRSVAEPVVVL